MSKELFTCFKLYKENSDSNNLYNLNLNIFNNYDFIKSLKKTDITHDFINSKKIKINDKEFDDDDIDKLPDIKDILAIKIDEKNNDKKNRRGSKS